MSLGRVEPGSGDAPRVVTALVVDDQRSFADAVALALDSQRDLRCVGAVGSVDQAMACLDGQCPDVMLLDVRLRGEDGIRAIPRFRERCPALRILVLTANCAPATFLAAARAGADGFVPKDTPFTEILGAVRRSDDLLLVDRATLDLIMRHAEEPPLDTPRPSLTPREAEVLTSLAQGMPVKHVARDLGMTVNTCRGHVRALLAKLEVHSQLGAVVKAAQLGLLPGLGDRGGRPPPARRGGAKMGRVSG